MKDNDLPPGPPAGKMPPRKKTMLRRLCRGRKAPKSAETPVTAAGPATTLAAETTGSPAIVSTTGSDTATTAVEPASEASFISARRQDLSPLVPSTETLIPMRRTAATVLEAPAAGPSRSQPELESDLSPAAMDALAEELEQIEILWGRCLADPDLEPENREMGRQHLRVVRGMLYHLHADRSPFTVPEH